MGGWSTWRRSSLHIATQSPSQGAPWTNLRAHRSQQMKEEKMTLLLPHIKGVSEKIDRVCALLGVWTVFRSNNTLWQLFMKVKMKTLDDQNKGVVYEVPCANYNNVHIGETGRNLKMRLKEHKYAVKWQDENRRIAAHTQESEHSVNWEAARVRTNEEHVTRRKVLESIFILESSNTNNLDTGLNLNPIWRSLLKASHASKPVSRTLIWHSRRQVGSWLTPFVDSSKSSYFKTLIFTMSIDRSA